MPSATYIVITLSSSCTLRAVEVTAVGMVRWFKEQKEEVIQGSLDTPNFIFALSGGFGVRVQCVQLLYQLHWK